MQRDGASFRDPSGHVYVHGSLLLRTLSAAALSAFEAVDQRPVIARMRAEGRLIDARLLPPSEWPAETSSLVLAPAGLVEHPLIPCWTYPYEWPFEALRAAALAHLDLHCDLLADDLTLTDASAYNMQFIGSRPIFIDVLSIRPHVTGEYWLGHDQFLRQFLNPLLLEAMCGVSFAASYRGEPEGFTSRDLTRLLPLRAWSSPLLLAHVILPTRLATRARARPRGAATTEGRARRPLPKSAYRSLLAHLRRLIAGLEVSRPATAWSGYDAANSYPAEARCAKEAFIRDFVAHTRPRRLVDLGCNDGAYSRIALEAGAASVIGLDTDRSSLDHAFLRALDANLPFLPLHADLANPSPAQGWLGRERRPLVSRLDADALLALAVVHHMAIGRNLPLGEVVDLFVSLARQGVLEFVPKQDPMVQGMLAAREDIFPDYGEALFRSQLTRHTRIVRETAVPGTERVLFWYDGRGP